MKTILGYEVKDGPAPGAPAVDDASAAVAHLNPYKNRDREHFVALYLNARQQLIALECVSVGTLSASLVHPREIFKGAILNNACALIIAHNHPSGDTTPSAEDKEATRRIARAGELMGIPLIDHVIIARHGGHFSFKENGIL